MGAADGIIIGESRELSLLHSAARSVKKTKLQNYRLTLRACDIESVPRPARMFKRRISD